MNFNVEIVLPSGKKCRVEELSNREYLHIIKFAQNEDYEGLNSFFEEKYLQPDMNILDRLYLLIYVRMLFINNSISITVKDKPIEIELTTILNKIENSYKDLETKFIENNIEVTLDLPCVSYYKSVDDLFISTIKKIRIANNSIVFNSITKEEQQEIINNLPVGIFKHIKKFIQTILDNLSEITIVQENESLGLQPIKFNIIGNGVMEFVSTLYGTDLKNFYSLIYIFENTVLPGSNLFFELSPVESQIILNNHSKRIKEENDKLQKQNQR